ncbi:restriction endonuclease subunit S [Pelotomaculum isophthalicicum JI]|uniref:Restriction endonuclease subunit S n=1 Tax=Pelotomaculum isophthalicicum JI TaxID=947010 RepID=A0A9X4JSR0_9FIRM|nr:restriction endonuclease subunit S [Pelotomaculum isophthalicicum]MDF9407179.1 restriction endonuclease subunit S [Pelotomaculum isophthalicicum JI]
MKPEIKKRIEQIQKDVVPTGYKKTKVGIVPNEWDVIQLKYILDQIERKVAKPEVGYWRLGLRSHAKGTFHEFVDDPDSIAMEELFSVAENDLIVNITFAWEHAIALANQEDEGKLVSHRFPTYVFNDKACPFFYKYYVIQPRFKKMLSDISPGGAGRNRVMSKSSFQRLFAIHPPLPEQKKIAEILSTWDKSIELKEKLIGEKKQQKKWLMQNLLTGKKRLPGFTDELQKVKLGDVCNVVIGQSPDSKAYNKDRVGIPLIQGNADCQKGVTKPRLWTTQITKTCYAGDIILTIRAPVGAVAIANQKACIGRGVSAIRPKHCQRYMYQYLLSIEDKWLKVSQGSTFDAISGNEIKKLKIIYPSTEEQTAIAEVLSTADREIDLHEKQLEELKKQKKALMQLLLTGMVRVNTQEVSS